MNSKKELPTLYGEKLYIPFVGAIIEQTNKEEQKQILIQTRQKKTDLIYNGCIEIPGGKLQAYEDIYKAIRREVKEECGLDVVFIQNENRRSDYTNKSDTSTLIEPFCVTQMHNGPFIGLIFLCQAIGIPSAKTNETTDAHGLMSKIYEKLSKKGQKKFTPHFWGL